MDQVAVVVSFSSRVFKRLPRIPLSLPGIGCPFQDPDSRFQESVAALMRLHTTPDFGANGVGILAWKGIRGLRPGSGACSRMPSKRRSDDRRSELTEAVQ